MPEELKKRLDKDTRDRLEKIQRGYEKWTRRTIRILTVLSVATLVLGALSINLLDSNGDRVDDIAAAQKNIQQSRVDNTHTACEEQNDRHDRTIAELDALIAAAEKDPSVSARRIARIKRSRESTARLIQALAPHQDCLELVRDRFGPQASPSVLK